MRRTRARRSRAFLAILIALMLLASVVHAVVEDEKETGKQQKQEEVLTLAQGKDEGSTAEWIQREVPTREEDGWRRLGNDEPVPKGSHVRLNMTSGEKWVKLEPTKGEHILSILEKLPDEHLTERVKQIRTLGRAGSEEFEIAAKSLWDERQQILESNQGNGTEEDQEPQVMALCKKLVPSQVSVEILSELDDIVDDIEQAISFANEQNGGIHKCLALIEDSSTSKEIKSLSAGVIGKTVKLMTDLQNLTITLGGFKTLNSAFQKGNIAEAKALFSIGSLVRGSDVAAAEALRHPDFFASLVARLSPSFDKKIRERAAALVGDLLMEPKEWCWQAFREASLCQASVEFSSSELASNKHFSYLGTIRDKVCIVRDEI